MSIKITDKIFEAFRDGDNDAFEIIFKGNFGRIVNFTTKIVKVESDAQELAQEVFVKLWENRQKVQSAATLNGYLYRLASNGAFRHLENKKREKKYVNNEMYVADFLTDIEGEIYAKELKLLLRMALSEMPEQRRRIFEMNRIEGLSIDEISAKLNITNKTVSNNIYEVLTELKKIVYIFMFFMTFFQLLK